MGWRPNAGKMVAMSILRRVRLAALSLAVVGASWAWAEPFHFVALGDLPYGPHDQAGPPYRALIAAINRDQPAFSIHVGDIKAGSTLCSDEEFERQRAHFALFEAGVVYTPGDNEWTDCHRPSNGRYDPLERLQTLRRLFYAPSRSLGRAPLPVENQSSLMPGHADYIENQRWFHDGVLFLTLHVVGSNNNLDARRPQTLPEFRAREAANIAWLRAGFALARARSAQAMVVAMQANPLGLINLSGTVAAPSGFHGIVGKTLLPLASDWGRPVLLVHGDTHRFRFDRPFWFQGQPLQTLMRLEVPGDGDVRAVRVDIDTRQSWPFSVRSIEAERP